MKMRILSLRFFFGLVEQELRQPALFFEDLSQRFGTGYDLQHAAVVPCRHRFIRRQQGQLVASQFGLLPNRCHKSENVQNHLILSQIIAGFEDSEDHIRAA